MSINMKFIALGSAGVVALAGAGVYAGTLTPSTGTAKSGAGAVVLQASCATAATITPGAATWNATSKKYEYTTLTVTGDDLANCGTQKATLNVHKLSDGSELAKTASAHTITSGEATAKSFTVTLDAGVDAGITAADYNYGLVIQTA